MSTNPVTLDKVQFVIGAEGKPTAVLVDLATGEHLLEALEEAEDVEVAQQALADLEAAGGDPRKAGYRPWSELRTSLEDEHAEE